jgi:hypothetical protein
MKYLNRKDVITAYVNYDARKKNNPIPKNLADWPWSDPNALDFELSRCKLFKHGIITGYKTWQEVQLSRLDLLNCAVVNDMFRDFHSPSEHLPRVLNKLIHHPVFRQWKPDRPTEWYEWLESGKPFPDDWPLILRPAVRSEAPAKWYIEDGSGRAVCFLRRLCNHPEENGTAVGYLGVEPDFGSKFMQQRFRELLIQT